MTLEFTKPEMEYLQELLQTTYKEKLHELNHTDTAEYKSLLKQEIAIIEGLIAKIKKSGDQNPA